MLLIVNVKYKIRDVIMQYNVKINSVLATLLKLKIKYYGFDKDFVSLNINFAKATVR